MALLVRSSGLYRVLYRDGLGCVGWVSDPPGLSRGLCLSFLCSRTISVVFRGGTGIYTGFSGDGVCWRVSPLGSEGVDGAKQHCLGAWWVLGYRYRYFQYW